MGYFHRDLENQLTVFIKSPAEQIILLSGARQTGKSTLIENLDCGMEKMMLNLWDEERPILALRNAATFSEFEHILSSVFHFQPDATKLLIIDEAQASEHLSSFIMEMHRTWRGQKVVLLGSLLANLFKKGKPLPAGRTVEFTCRPLNFREFMRFRGKEDLLGLVQGDDYSRDIHELLMEEYHVFLQIGGLPGVVVASGQGQNLRLLFDSLLGLLYRDADRFVAADGVSGMPRMAQFGRILETVLGAIASHTGSPTQNATLLSTDSPAYRTILPLVLEALWAWHLAYLVPFETARQTTKKGYSSKKYLFDTGVANFLLTRLMPVHLGDGGEVAAMLLENAVLQDCVSTVESIRAVTCYRSNNKVPTELDFVLSQPGCKLPIEVKSSKEVKRQTLSQLMDFLERTGSAKGIVVYAGMPRTEEIRGRMLQFIPPYKVIGMLSGE